jgi:hydrogenase nickel incorporation protein HypA/HybF
MHELPVTQSLLDIALRHAGQAGARRVTDLFIVVGELSSMIDDSVQFYWDILSRGTMAEGARLHFKRIPAEMQCMVCAQIYRPGRDDFACPACGSVGAKIIAGEELFLDAIDVENGKEP